MKFKSKIVSLIRPEDPTFKAKFAGQFVEQKLMLSSNFNGIESAVIRALDASSCPG